MKRKGDIKDKFLQCDNFDMAEKKARKTKSGTYGVRQFDKERESHLQKLIEMFRDGAFKSSEPKTFTMCVDGGKVREITKMPYFPDRIAHHAVLNMIEPWLTRTFIANTFNSIKNRGIHLLNQRLKHDLHIDPVGTEYCLKIDIRKFYQSIPLHKMKEELRRYIKDKWFMAVIDEMMDTTDGLSIGGLLSQIFSNTYISRLDHFIKEELRVKHYYRYADDMVFLSDDKKSLHEILWRVRNYLWYNLDLELKKNWQVFRVDERGIDYIGFIFRHSHVRIRKRVKKNFIKKRHNVKSVASYKGMLKWCDSKHLIYNTLELNNYAKERTDFRKQVY